MNDSLAVMERPQAANSRSSTRSSSAPASRVIFMLYRLRELGMTARVFETGSNVGGTWYLEPLPRRAF